MLKLAHGVNAIPLSMSLTWPTADQKKSCASTGMGPFHAQSYTHKQLASAHQAHNGLPHRTITWAPMILVSRTAAGPYARIGPWCECNSIVDELDLAHGRSKEIMCKHRHGPISCTVIYTQAARIGPSSKQWAAAQDYHMGPHDFSQWDSCQPYA